MCGSLNWFGFVSFNSLTIHGELNHIIVSSRYMFTPSRMVNLGKCGRRVLQSGMRSWFHTWTRGEKCVFHECVSVVYPFVRHVNVYMLLCIHCHDHGYACIVGKRCIVMVIVVVFFHHDAINMLL